MVESCVISSKFWRLHTVETFSCRSPTNDSQLYLTENLIESSTKADYLGIKLDNLDNVPFLSISLLLIAIFELIHQLLGNKNSAEHFNWPPDSLRSSLVRHSLIISQLLLATTIPTAWFVPNYGSRDYLLRGLVQFFFWSVMIILSHTDRKSLTPNYDKWNWVHWRTALLYVLNNLERIWWLYNSFRF